MSTEFQKYDTSVKVWGDLACFTRPEFKVERVSYPVITPSAARGVLEAIFWKPEFRWEIREIWVLRPIKEIAIMRNEIRNRQSGRTSGPFFVEDKRQPRTSLFLKEPAYLIMADIRLKATTRDSKKKYLEQFKRRLERGQCHYQPYLGTRECSAYFEMADGSEKPIDENIEIGNMLFDIAYIQSNTRQEIEFIKHKDDNDKVVSGYAKPLFFYARLDKGILRLPWEKYRELYEMEGGVHVRGIS